MAIAQAEVRCAGVDRRVRRSIEIGSAVVAELAGGVGPPTSDLTRVAVARAAEETPQRDLGHIRDGDGARHSRRPRVAANPELPLLVRTPTLEDIRSVHRV